MKIEEWLKTATKWDYIYEASCYFMTGFLFGIVVMGFVILLT